MPTYAKESRHKVAASIDLSRAHESEGQYDQAMAVIDAARMDRSKNPDLLARRAEILFLRGRWEEADKDASAILAKDPDHFLAHWVLGQILRDPAELDNADEHFRRVVPTYTERSNMNKDITVPDLLV